VETKQKKKQQKVVCEHTFYGGGGRLVAEKYMMWKKLSADKRNAGAPPAR